MRASGRMRVLGVSERRPVPQCQPRALARLPRRPAFRARASARSATRSTSNDSSRRAPTSAGRLRDRVGAAAGSSARAVRRCFSQRQASPPAVRGLGADGRRRTRPAAIVFIGATRPINQDIDAGSRRPHPGTSERPTVVGDQRVLRGVEPARSRITSGPPTSTCCRQSAKGCRLRSSKRWRPACRASRRGSPARPTGSSSTASTACSSTPDDRGRSRRCDRTSLSGSATVAARLGAAARETVVARYSIQGTAAAWLSAYRERRRSPRRATSSRAGSRRDARAHRHHLHFVDRLGLHLAGSPGDHGDARGRRATGCCSSRTPASGRRRCAIFPGFASASATGGGAPRGFEKSSPTCTSTRRCVLPFPYSRVARLINRWLLLRPLRRWMRAIGFRSAARLDIPAHAAGARPDPRHRSATDDLLLHRRPRLQLAGRQPDRSERAAAVPRSRPRVRHVRKAARSAPRG